MGKKKIFFILSKLIKNKNLINNFFKALSLKRKKCFLKKNY